MKRFLGANAGYLELFEDRRILRRFHKRPRVFLCAPEQRMLLSCITCNDFTRKRRTVFQSSNGEQREFREDWDGHQTRVQGLNGEQWLGPTEVRIGSKHHGFKPKRRIHSKKSETELKDEEFQRHIKEDMQTRDWRTKTWTSPRGSQAHGRKQDTSGSDIIFNKGGLYSWRERIPDPSCQNFNQTVSQASFPKANSQGALH